MNDSNNLKPPSKIEEASELLEALPRGENALMSFFDMEGIGLAIAAEGFTREELTRTVISQIRDPDPRVSQRAIVQFRSMVRETLELNGRIGKAAQTRSKNGETQSVTTTGIIRPKPIVGTAPPPVGAEALGRTFINPLPIGAALDSHPDASLEANSSSFSKRSAVPVEAPAPRPGHLPTGSVPPAAPPAV